MRAALFSESEEYFFFKISVFTKDSFLVEWLTILVIFFYLEFDISKKIIKMVTFYNTEHYAPFTFLPGHFQNQSKYFKLPSCLLPKLQVLSTQVERIK